MPIHDPLPTRADLADTMQRAAAAEYGGDGADPVPAFPRMTCARLREWVKAARPGARIVYARGRFVDEHADVAMCRLAGALGPRGSGYLSLHLTRPGPGQPIDYLAVRTKRPVQPGAVL